MIFLLSCQYKCARIPIQSKCRQDKLLFASGNTIHLSLCNHKKFRKEKYINGNKRKCYPHYRWDRLEGRKEFSRTKSSTKTCHTFFS